MSNAAAITHSEPAVPMPVNLVKFGMITFLASEAMLFAGLISAYLISWIGHAVRPTSRNGSRTSILPGRCS